MKKKKSGSTKGFFFFYYYFFFHFLNIKHFMICLAFFLSIQINILETETEYIHSDCVNPCFFFLQVKSTKYTQDTHTHKKNIKNHRDPFLSIFCGQNTNENLLSKTRIYMYKTYRISHALSKQSCDIQSPW